MEMAFSLLFSHATFKYSFIFHIFRFGKSICHAYFFPNIFIIGVLTLNEKRRTQCAYRIKLLGTNLFFMREIKTKGKNGVYGTVFNGFWKLREMYADARQNEINWRIDAREMYRNHLMRIISIIYRKACRKRSAFIRSMVDCQRNSTVKFNQFIIYGDIFISVRTKIDWNMLNGMKNIPCDVNEFKRFGRLQ